MIIDHPTLRFRFNDSRWWNRMGVCHVVKCDHCGRLAKNVGKDAGEATDLALREGFRFLREAVKWHCCECKDSRDSRWGKPSGY
jgi:hypothetical protein